MLVDLIICTILIALDQYTKFLVDLKLGIHQTMPVIQDFFHITYVQNKGIAFGMFYGYVNVLKIIGIIAIIGIIIYMYIIKKNNDYSIYSRFAFVFILAGAVGNWYDRAFRGFVIDFIDFRGIWAYIFNMADVFVNIGAALMILEYIYEKRRKKATEGGELE